MALFPHTVPGCRVETKGGITNMSLNSLDAALRQSEQGPSHFWRGRVSSRARDELDWYGTRSFEEAVSLGRYGWKQGRDKLIDAQLSLRDLAEGHISLRSEDRDVYGNRPDVPLFCAGDPEHMVVPGDRFGPSAPLVDLLVQCSVSHFNQANLIVNYGAALTSLIDATEAERRRVRVTCAFGIKEGPLQFNVLVRVKDHNEPLDIDRVAFALANPSMFRRIVFALVEQGQSQTWFQHFEHGYGRPNHVAPRGNEIVVPSLQNWKGKGDWSTPVSAFETMKDALVKELNGDEEQDDA